MFAGMEQFHDFLGNFGNRCEVGPFVGVAPVACQRQVVGVITAMMLSCPDVFHVVTDGHDFLWDATVFTALIGSLPNQRFGGRIHTVGGSMPRIGRNVPWPG